MISRSIGWTASCRSGRTSTWDDPAAGLGVIEADLAKPPIPVSTIAQRNERDFYLNGSYLLLGEGYASTQPKQALAYYDNVVDHVAQMQHDVSSGLGKRSHANLRSGGTV